jgi:hypothetical protein
VRIEGQYRGNRIYFDDNDGKPYSWDPDKGEKGLPVYYADTDEEVDLEAIPCPSCGRCAPAANVGAGAVPDPCLGMRPGVISACCGHGVRPGIIVFSDGVMIPVMRPKPPAI